MRLVLVRHGETEAGQGRAVGHLDLPMSTAGARAVAALARCWRGPAPGRIVASDLRRAVDSARLLARRHGSAGAETDPRLRELSFGEWEGLTWDEIHRRDRRRLESWGRRWWEAGPPGGETYAELSARVMAWFAELSRESAREEREQERGEAAVILVVAHGGSLRALLAGLLDLPPAEVFDLRLDYAHVSEVDRKSVV